VTVEKIHFASTGMLHDFVEVAMLPSDMASCML
jgi:hypothetical protein